MMLFRVCAIVCATLLFLLGSDADAKSRRRTNRAQQSAEGGQPKIVVKFKSDVVGVAQAGAESVEGVDAIVLKKVGADAASIGRELKKFNVVDYTQTFPSKFFTSPVPIGSEFTEAAKATARQNYHSLYVTYRFQKGASLSRILNKLKGDSRIEYAEEVVVGAADFVPTDPRFGEQWSHVAAGSTTGWGLTRGKPSVAIAIVDTGVSLTHEDLAGRIDQKRAFNAESPGGLVDDSDGHGTHCAGIAAASASNGVGVSGVCPECTIVPIKASSFQSDVVARAVRYAADVGVQVISMSFRNPPSKIFYEALDYPAAKGVILVASGGNFNEFTEATTLLPRGHPSVIVVSATTRFGEKAYYSNFGPRMDISAPGGDGDGSFSGILSTWKTDGEYRSLSGTSMAAPFVAGAIGLYLSVLDKPLSLDPLRFRQLFTTILRQTGTPPRLGSAGVPNIINVGKLVAAAVEGNKTGGVPISSAGTTEFFVAGDAGDPITGGQTWLGTQEQYEFKVSGTKDYASLYMVAKNGSSKPSSLSLIFAPPEFGGALSPRTYPSAKNFGSQQDAYLSVSAEGRSCRVEKGSFTVHEYVLRPTPIPNGASPFMRLRVSFEQECTEVGKKLRGWVVFTAHDDPINSPVRLLPGKSFRSGILSQQPADKLWEMVSVGNLDGKLSSDLVWRNREDGRVAMWSMDGLNLVTPIIFGNAPLEWRLAGVGDLDRDGDSDLVWHNEQSGEVGFWWLNGTNIVSTNVHPDRVFFWKLVGVGDMNGDGYADLRSLSLRDLVVKGPAV